MGGAQGPNACKDGTGHACISKHLPFLLGDNVGPMKSVKSPCEVCAQPAELCLNENSCEHDATVVVNGYGFVMSLFESIEAPHRGHTASSRLTAMSFSMRQQKLDRLCRGICYS